MFKSSDPLYPEKGTGDDTRSVHQDRTHHAGKNLKEYFTTASKAGIDNVTSYYRELSRIPMQIAFEALEKVKKLRWGKTTILNITNPVLAGTILQTRNEIISCIKIIAENHPDTIIRRKISTNAINLAKDILSLHATSQISMCLLNNHFNVFFCQFWFAVAS